MPVKVIDLRSDTVTLPTDEMRRAMYEADLGDDVYGEDPTINRLEQMTSEMLGKEAALFTSSGTMGNLLAILAQTRPGEEVIVGSEAHIFWYEVGGASALGGVMLRTVLNDSEGRMDLDSIEQAIRGRNIHFPRTALLCLENTHNRCGGTVLTPDFTSSVALLAHGHDLRIHLDGARIFNASIALGVPASDLTRDVDSVCFCLSKGLSAPVGSMLCGTKDFVESARKWRKMVGGGMRQAGVIAAAGIVALQTTVDRLSEDHANARRLARGLENIPGLSVLRVEVPSNIVMFESALAVSGADFTRRMDTLGVKFGDRGDNHYRAVAHRMVDSADVDEALDRFEQCAKGLG